MAKYDAVINVQVLNYLISQLRFFRQERAALGSGYIVKDRNYFYEINGDTRRGITKDKERVRQLMRAKFLDLKIAEIEQYISKISKIEKLSHKLPDSVKYIQDRFQLTGYDLGNVIWNDFQRQCIGHQSENPYAREQLKLVTNNGVKVRSISEQTIGNIYESYNIPYLYEKRITVDVSAMPDVIGARTCGNTLVKDYYPDFTILLANYTSKYHEHFGLINNMDYVKSSGEKIIAYTSSGLITADQMILTFPKDIYDQSNFVNYVQEKILPYV